MALAGVAFLQTRVEGFEFGRGGGGGEDRAIMTDGGRVGGVYAWTVFVGGVVDAQQGAEVCVRVYYSGWGWERGTFRLLVLMTAGFCGCKAGWPLGC